ncbi:MAG: hypothetical protein OZ921_13475 [Sorangiineae bacterium]|nr:hypothetical protein [Polyangiaceae bacterium]MEB2323516.1 hypothetical protein [Sorangiineae bacterium]
MRAQVALLCALSATPALAQTRASAEQAAAAESLFESAKGLMAEQRYAAACARFADSYRLDPGVGVLLYLGDCYEKNGQTASAWATFRDAVASARAAQQPARAAAAQQRADALEPRLSRLRIVVPPASAVEGLVIRRDRVALARAVLDVPVAVDPGTFAIEASAPGRVAFSTRVEVPAGPATVEVTIPPLAVEPAASAAPAPAAPLRARTARAAQPARARAGMATPRPLVFALAGVGAAGLIVGSVYGLKTISTWSDARAHCDAGSPRRCDDIGLGLQRDARQDGMISTLAFAAGGAATLGAAVLWLTAAPPRATTGWRLVPALDRSTVVATAAGAF